MERIKELESILSEVCEIYENDCSKCPRLTECEEYCKRCQDIKRTGLKFAWNSGSQNDNAIKIFREKNINYEYDSFFNLTADFFGNGIFKKVIFQHLENDYFEICIA